MLQCTDPDRFFYEENLKTQKHEVLFVGNSRNVYRDSVRNCIEINQDLAIYGSLWSQFVPKKFIFGENIPNDELRKHYASSSVVLNDHWDSMRSEGFMSNRLFDAVASGAVVLSDRVEGFDDDYFGESVVFYDDARDFENALSIAKRRSPDMDAMKKVRKYDSFDTRAKSIIEAVMAEHKNRTG